MKAVNLIPTDARRGAAGPVGASLGPAHAVLGLLAVAVALMTLYVLTTNTISARKVKVATLTAQLAQAQAQAARLTNYAQFEKLAQARAETVREIAASRFDWKAALSDLSKVVPANTSLQSLVGTVAPGGSVSAGGGAAGAPTGGLRAAISAPAFEMRGCTSTHDDVARLMSRLRLVNGVTRVSLSDSQKGDSTQSAASVKSGRASGAAAGCKPNAPSFDLVVFFQPLPGAGPAGVTSVTPQSVTNGGAPAGATTSAQPVSNTAAPGGSK